MDKLSLANLREVMQLRLSGIAIQKYRSIKKTARLDLGGLTVLVGPNNEGKSNILRAVVTSMKILRRFSSTLAPGRTVLRRTGADYDWTEDYPKDLQDRSPDGNTIIDLWFELNDSEKLSFRRAIGVQLKTELPIRLTLGRQVEFTVRKQGPGKQTLMQKASRVAQFIGQTLRIEYVPSIRTAADAAEVVRNMLLFELDELLDKDEYKDALTALQSALNSALHPMATDLAETLTDFLPEVQNVEVQLPVDDLLGILAEKCRIVVDDGVPTDLRMKGDGVQSLAALALARKAADLGRRSLFLAVEEPEAHLHPRAVHQVRAVLHEIAEKKQIAITTHSPLLVDRFNLSNNIIVRENKAQQSASLRELRAALGVRAADNLSSASLIVLVEGGCDELALKAIFSTHSGYLRNQLSSGELAIGSMSSASNLSTRLEMLRSQICRYVVLLDNDAAGILAAKKARDEGLLSSREEYFAIAPGMKESELEDCLDPSVYFQAVMDRFGVNLNVREFRSSKRKWSSRVESCFRTQGKLLDDATKLAVKSTVSESVLLAPEKSIHAERSRALIALCEDVERRLTGQP
ncbi:MAG TPA: AAA family ATPase [Actinophytocola sp.]|uniref:ATP-dependent nuclease n=1 Tax=Actinophytocola sp. TaxID=1872138 RepID=UPI002DB6B702|nr:AAA family ATPase [Actinophytocola sp.]HEU5475297.1 AAA family ATPase [Actinophytocola sp.]